MRAKATCLICGHSKDFRFMVPRRSLRWLTLHAKWCANFQVMLASDTRAWREKLRKFHV